MLARQMRVEGIVRHELIGHLTCELRRETLRFVVRDEFRMLDVGWRAISAASSSAAGSCASRSAAASAHSAPPTASMPTIVAVVAAVTSVWLLAPAPANPSSMPAVAMIPSFAIGSTTGATPDRRRPRAASRADRDARRAP